MCLNKIKIERVNENKELETLYVPCGKCLECLMQKSTDIQCRGIIEFKNWNNINKNNKGAFITLTYKDSCLPDNRSLKRQDYIVFVRELRRWIKKNENKINIRILGCGEYGTLRGRPHYHLIIFNWLPDDLVPDYSAKAKESTNMLYKSKLLSEIWGKGRVVIGIASERAVGYIAGYTTKKGFKINASEKYINFEDKYEKEKESYINFDKENGIIIKKYRIKKDNPIEFCRRIKKREVKDYIKQPEFVSMPKGKIGGLGSLTEKEMVDLIKNTTISLNTGNNIKTFNVPYYYIKKTKEILKKRELQRDFILNYDTPKNDVKEIIDKKDKRLAEMTLKESNDYYAINRKKILKIYEALENYDLMVSNYFWNTLELANKHNMQIDEWKKYQSKIRLKKMMNRIKNLDRDFEKPRPGELKDNGRAWLLDNDIGKRVAKAREPAII